MSDQAVREIRAQTDKMLWEVGNVLDCLRDSQWDAYYCGMPAWKHAYHMLHSLDQWFVNPARYADPDFHAPNLNNLDEPCLETLDYPQLCAYLAQIRAKLEGYLSALTDDQLLEAPPDCPYSRLTLILGQYRHLNCHLGMLMGFLIRDTGEWPYVLGLTRPIPDGPYDKYF